MRSLVILFMIVLLPLRGWAGDVMGVQMAAATAASQDVKAMPADCPMHAQTERSGSSDAPSAMAGCGSCDLCIPMAGLATARLDSPMLAAHSVPCLASVGFISAARALALKPPIS